MPVISAERMQQRYDGILDAAKTVFAREGYEGASIAAVAKAAGVSDGLIYRYFANKRDLLDRVLEAFYERIIHDLEETVAQSRRFEERLHGLIRRHIEVFVADIDLCRLFISEVRVASDYQNSTTQKLNRRYTSILVGILDEAIKQGEVREGTNSRLIRDVIFGAVEHLSWPHVTGRGRVNIASTAQDLTDLILRGVQPAESRS